MRQLARNPGYAALVVLLLGAGFGAALAVVEIADAVLLQPLPYRDAGRLVNAWQSDLRGGGTRLTVTGADFVAWRGETAAFEGMAAVSARGFNVLAGERPERIDGAIVSDDFFAVMGAAPSAGALFSPGARGGRQAVISASLWRARFGGAASVVGRSIALDGEPATIIGVAADEFRYPPGAELWLTARTRAPEHPTYRIEPDTDRSRHYLTVVARLRDGVSFAQAQAALQLAQARLAREFPDDEKEIGAFLVPLREQLFGAARPQLEGLFGAALVLLFVAWANAAHLVLVRAAARAHEVAVRRALGATRADVWRLFFGESSALALAAAALGLVAAAITAPALIAHSPQAVSLPPIALGWPTLAAAALLAMGAAGSLGAVAALHPLALSEALQHGSRAGTAGRGHSALRRALLAFEVALSLVLLLGAGLLGRSLARVLAVDPGFQPAHVLAVDLPLPAARYADKSVQARFAADLLRNLRNEPQLDSAGLVSRLPLSPSNTVGELTIPGREAEAFACDLRLASDGYFEALRIPLRAGRTFAPRDLEPGAPAVAIINQAAAKRAFGSESPIGRRILVWGEKQPSEVVGVVGDLHHAGLDAEPRPEAYRPLGAIGWTNLSLVARGRSSANALAQPVRTAVAALDAELPLVRLQPMDERVAASLALRRFTLALLSTLAVLALLLALAGIYGVTAYLVAQRTRELGVRLALGATPLGLVGFIAGDTMRAVALGALSGVIASALLARLLRGLLFGVQPIDPLTYATLALALGVVAGLATLAAALRALRLSPAEALRE